MSVTNKGVMTMAMHPMKKTAAKKPMKKMGGGAAMKKKTMTAKKGKMAKY